MGTKTKKSVKSFIEKLSERTRKFGDQNKQGPAKEARALINKQLSKKASSKKKAAPKAKPPRKSGGILSQKFIKRERAEADVRRRVQQEPTTSGRGKVAKVEIERKRSKLTKNK